MHEFCVCLQLQVTLMVVVLMVSSIRERRQALDVWPWRVVNKTRKL